MGSLCFSDIFTGVKNRKYSPIRYMMWLNFSIPPHWEESIEVCLGEPDSGLIRRVIKHRCENMAIKIWVDADACPNVIKDVLFRAAEREQVPLTLVANQPLRTPPSRFIKSIKVAAGFDVADNEIVKLTQTGDLVITADIPLAAEVIEKGGFALNPRGEMYTVETIRQKLTMRDFMDELRASGVNTGGPPTISQRDRQSFANELDRFLTRNK